MMLATAKDGVRLAYESVGQGRDIVLVHGFGSSRTQNWANTGWYDELQSLGMRVTALDCRGHGDSDKPHTQDGYRHDEMAGDVIAVMTAAGISRAIVMGYSMGGLIAIHLAHQHPEKVSKLIVGGVGESYLGRDDVSGDRVANPAVRARIVEALLAEDPSTITTATARAFRAFADQPGKDRLALAACMAASSPYLRPGQLAAIPLPCLVVCGERDDISGKPEGLARAFGHGSAVSIPNRDHMTAVGDKLYMQAVGGFLKS